MGYFNCSTLYSQFSVFISNSILSTQSLRIVYPASYLTSSYDILKGTSNLIYSKFYHLFMPFPVFCPSSLLYFLPQKNSVSHDMQLTASTLSSLSSNISSSMNELFSYLCCPNSNSLYPNYHVFSIAFI